MITSRHAGFVSIGLGAFMMLSAALLPVPACAQSITAKATEQKAIIPIRVSNVAHSTKQNQAFVRYVSIFSGPPGPTMPLGATLNPSANTGPRFDPVVLRVASTTTLVVLDLPPGARRKTGTP